MRFVAAIALLLAACGGSVTEIVAVADSDLRGAEALDSVRFEVGRPGEPFVESVAPWAPGSPAFVGIVHEGGSLGPIEVRAVGLRGGAEVLERRARVSFVEGRIVVLRLDLFARCVGRTCGAEQTCAANDCRSVDVGRGELDDWTGSPGGLDAGAPVLDAGVDAGVDAGSDAGAGDGGCLMRTEACNGLNYDCDGVIDEMFSLHTDPENCGACGHACASECQARACAGDPVAIAIGGVHACAVGATGVTHCWGENGEGQLGDGTTTPAATPSPVLGAVRALELAAGGLHTCARTASGVSCWGRGDRGQLGNGGTSSTAPVAAIGLSGVVSICAGAEHTCVVDATGVVSCFGDNGAGQTGGSAGTTVSPSPVVLPNALEVACGAQHTCAIAGAERSVHCWGDNAFGQLGRTGAGGPMPMAVAGLTGVARVAAGREHTCVLLADGRAQCFGNNDNGQLGNNSTAEGPTARYVNLLDDAIALAAGGLHTCAVRTNGESVCWGRRSEGAIGDDMLGLDARSPSTVLGLADAVRVYAGPDATCARRAGARVSCWGTMSGGLGDGSTTSSATPIEITIP